MKQNFSFCINCVSVNVDLNESACNSKQKWDHNKCWL